MEIEKTFFNKCYKNKTYIKKEKQEKCYNLNGTNFDVFFMKFYYEEKTMKERVFFLVGTILILMFTLNSNCLSQNNNNIFGSSEENMFSLIGKIYYISEGTEALPDFSKLKPVGKIFTRVLNIKPRKFSEGFPGVGKRFEWFAIDYRGKFYISEDKEMEFSLLSDDGSKLIIDNKCIIGNDGIHPPIKKRGKVFLKKGFHKIEVQYFQGPRYQVALVLSYIKNGKEIPFNIKDFIPLKINETKCKINLKIGDKILFDFNKYNLKKSAEEILVQLIKELKNIKFKEIIIEGHTDSIGSEVYNLKLSKKRAKAVANFLIQNGVPEEKIKIIGYGEKKPIASNKTEIGRAKNRRVEIKIIKECKEKTQSEKELTKITLLKISENPSLFTDKTIIITGYAKGWAAKDIPEKIRNLFLNLPLAKGNTGLSRNWGSFTDGTAVILFPVAPTEFGKFRVKFKIITTNNERWYVKVFDIKKTEEE